MTGKVGVASGSAHASIYINIIFLAAVVLVYAVSPPAFDWGFLFFSSTAIVLVTSHFSINKNSMATLYVFCHLALFYTSPIVSYIAFGDFLPRSPRYVDLTNFLSVSSLHIFLIGYCLFCGRDSVLTLVSVSRGGLRFSSLALYAVFLFSSVWLFYSVGGFDSAYSSRIDIKYITGVKIYAQLLLYTASSSIFFVTVYLRVSNANPIAWMAFISSLLLANVIIFLAMRTRTEFAIHAFALLIGWSAAHIFRFHDGGMMRALKGKKLEARNINITGLLVRVIPIIMIGVFLRSFRGVFFESSSSSYNVEVMIQRTLEGGDLGYSIMVMDSIEFIERTYGFLYGQSYYRLILSFFPKVIVGEKPPTTQSLIGQGLTGVEVMTIPPGVFGDAYINFGFYGLIMFVLYGALVAISDKKMKTFTKFSVFSVSIVPVFHFVRGASENPVIIMILMVIAIYFVKYNANPRDASFGLGALRN